MSSNGGYIFILKKYITSGYDMKKQLSIEAFIRGIPKAELHLHIEGTLEPELMFKIARRNNIKLRYKSVEQLKKAYHFSNLQDFLDIYYEGAGILITEQDFYDLTWEYVKKVHTHNVLHAEIFFDPQTHTSRGVMFSTVIQGIYRALTEARKKLGISSKLIMCFLRDMDEDSAMKTLELSLPFQDRITAVGLDSAELGNPPSKFKAVFDRAREAGFLSVAHAGEEGPARYVWEAIEILKVSRIDHSNHALDDDKLVKQLVRRKIPLTVCPLSNVKLSVVKEIKKHPLKIMMEKGLFVTINSDDPAYFGGYINENYLAVQKALDLDRDDIYTLARNSFHASFLEAPLKERMIKRLDEFVRNASTETFS
jgi:adenosine deaminase